jgi:hypothetical protein
VSGTGLVKAEAFGRVVTQNFNAITNSQSPSHLTAGLFLLALALFLQGVLGGFFVVRLKLEPAIGRLFGSKTGDPAARTTPAQANAGAPAQTTPAPAAEVSGLIANTKSAPPVAR